jgi:Asp-tRNA(Asn)/Glu-tRNA(Gln) amidotransferase A subunit family amidase
MGDEQLCYLSAVEARAMFETGKLSPVELMRAIIARSERVEPAINAFTDTFFEAALVQAEQAETRFARARRGKGTRLRPLEGLPLAIKDEMPVEGQRCTDGSLVYRDRVATETAITAQRLLGAGAIQHARTTTPEFCCATITSSRLFGVTHNPWNRRYTPGGSSGGSAASLAAGTSMLTTGSDIAGSIRVPASCCGIVGFKPPYGRVPQAPPFNLDFYCHEGPLARTVSDTALIQNAIAGPHPKDITSLKPKLRIPAAHGDVRGWRIAYSLDLGYFQVSPEVRRNTLAALEVFTALGCEVHEVKVPWTEASARAAWCYLAHLFGASLAEVLEEQADELTPYARAFIESGARSSAGDYVDSLEVAGEMYAWFGPMLEGYDVFVCPTTTTPAIAADADLEYESFEAKGKAMPDGLSWCMTYPFNMLSRCPVLAVPSGFAKTGVPTGIQIVGKTYEDVKVFRAGTAFEQASPWLHDAEHRPSL